MVSEGSLCLLWFSDSCSWLSFPNTHLLHVYLIFCFCFSEDPRFVYKTGNRIGIWDWLTHHQAGKKMPFWLVCGHWESLVKSDGQITRVNVSQGDLRKPVNVGKCSFRCNFWSILKDTGYLWLQGQWNWLVTLMLNWCLLRNFNKRLLAKYEASYLLWWKQTQQTERPEELIEPWSSRDIYIWNLNVQPNQVCRANIKAMVGNFWDPETWNGEISRDVLFWIIPLSLQIF